MRRFWSAVAVVVASPLFVASPAAAAHAAPSPIVSSRDDRNDVRVYPRERGLSGPERRSIDIHRFTITDLGNKVRFEVKWKGLIFNHRFDQMLFVSMRATKASGDTESSQVGLSPQAPKAGYAYWYADDTGETYHSCDPLRSRARAAGNRAWIDVPNRCLPLGPVLIEVTALAGGFRGDGPRWSSDRVPVPGAHYLI